MQEVPLVKFEILRMRMIKLRMPYQIKSARDADENLTPRLALILINSR